MYLTLIFSWGLVKGGVILYYVKKNCGLSLSMYLKSVLVPCVVTSLFMAASGIAISYFIDESIFRLIIVMTATTFVFIITQRYLFMTNTEAQIIKIIYKKAQQKISFSRIV